MKQYAIFKGKSEELTEGSVYEIDISADGERAVRARVNIFNIYMLYEDFDAFVSEWGFYEEIDDIRYLLGMERYINCLQAELDRKKERALRMMGKEYDDKVIG